MSKYDFEIDLSANSSTGVILQKINRGASVLEFGCAAGRMTRYMKEKLDCRVCIVEYDAAAYDKARQYAEAGICGDIMQMQWREAFGEKRFDAILFADVLEHLSDPEKILRSASELLADKGCLYVSLPNITHNDILLKAWEERFDYTATGLLDDTHVHFWGLENLKTLAQNCGLSLRKIEATYCPTGYTEQYAGRERQKDLLLENLLRQRQGGEVYQFVLTLDKSGETETVCTVTAPSIQSHIYLDTGNGINAEQVIAVDSRYSAHGSYLTHYVIKGMEELKQIRFDPLEFQGCILRKISVRQAGEECALICPGAVQMDDGILLPGNDPMVYAQVTAGDAPVELEAEFLMPGERYLALIEEAYTAQDPQFHELRSQVDGLQLAVKNLTLENGTLQGQVATLSSENGALHGRVDGLTGENAVLHGQVTELTNERRALRQNVKDLTGTTQTLERWVRNLEQETASLRIDLGASILLANNKDKYALELERELDYYKNLRIIRMRTFILRALRWLKRRVKRLIGREARS